MTRRPVVQHHGDVGSCHALVRKGLRLRSGSAHSRHLIPAAKRNEFSKIVRCCGDGADNLAKPYQPVGKIAATNKAATHGYMDFVDSAKPLAVRR
jgi:hypothetical protein